MGRNIASVMIRAAFSRCSSARRTSEASSEIAAFRAFGEKEGVSAEGDKGAFYLFVFLVVACALMSEIPVPGIQPF